MTKVHKTEDSGSVLWIALLLILTGAAVLTIVCIRRKKKAENGTLRGPIEGIIIVDGWLQTERLDMPTIVFTEEDLKQLQELHRKGSDSGIRWSVYALLWKEYR